MADPAYAGRMKNEKYWGERDSAQRYLDVHVVR